MGHPSLELDFGPPCLHKRRRLGMGVQARSWRGQPRRSCCRKREVDVGITLGLIKGGGRDEDGCITATHEAVVEEEAVVGKKGYRRWECAKVKKSNETDSKRSNYKANMLLQRENGVGN
ncbi:Uncharacterized protein Fot_32633 [Forsythia ovata]|uniref:Uncharacterized protein n=1 Tax=Forsythia ovata TaxID=205694 RepID=A0ABD1T8D6_9LAMI